MQFNKMRSTTYGCTTIKQHLAAIRMMFSWLTEKGVLDINPAREVKTPKLSRIEGNS
jgi:site-specific recombinase XerC